MTTAIHKNLTQRMITGLVFSTLVALMAWPSGSSADEIRLRPYNNGRGMHSPVRTPQERGESSQALRLSGTFRYSPRDGLSLADRPIVLSGGTTVFPSIRDQSYLPDPSQLRGRQGTIYGRQGPNGIEAVLVILESTDPALPKIGGPDAEQMQVGDPSRGPVAIPAGTPE